MSLRHLVPSPFDSDETSRRFAHQDVRELAPAQLWAELTTLDNELARRMVRGVRPRIVKAWPTVVDDHAWIVGRRRALRAEQRRRADQQRRRGNRYA